ncbi:hypothetical protein [Marinobacter sp. OP 3.4]|uniref:hypothetical protein n=1 Tax=Marinobacter sp. OP 3.4 TaxID=3076501 RepID=UPI002E1DECE1
MPGFSFRFPVLLLLLVSVGVLAQPNDQQYPDVIDVQVTSTGENRYRFEVTLSSPYDTPERYADAFRVKTVEGQTLGVRELLHHHANEQPFTRSLNNVEIPPGITDVIVEGRDQDHGYGGAVRRVAVPDR